MDGKLCQSPIVATPVGGRAPGDVFSQRDSISNPLPETKSIPFLLAKSAPCRCGKLPERTLEKLSLCDDIAIVMFAFVFLVCSEKSKDQCVCLRLSEVRLIHHLNIEEPPSTP